MADKQGMRRAIRQLLARMSREERERQSRAVRDRIQTSTWFVKSKTIGVYLSLEREVNTWPLVEHALALNKRVLVPRFSAVTRQMDLWSLHSVADLHALPEGTWRVKQPESTCGRESALSVGVDVVLVPGVAFTASGQRLGNGGGFYDRFLERLFQEGQRPLLVGLAFTQQLVERLPRAPHDFQMDLVVSP